MPNLSSEEKSTAEAKIALAGEIRNEADMGNYYLKKQESFKGTLVTSHLIFNTRPLLG